MNIEQQIENAKDWLVNGSPLGPHRIVRELTAALERTYEEYQRLSGIESFAMGETERADVAEFELRKITDSEPEGEREYRRVKPDGTPVFNAVFESVPLLDEMYTAEYRTVSPWLSLEDEG